MSLNLAILFTSLLGFIGLALAMPKHASVLLQTTPTTTLRQLARVTGWLLLLLALLLGIYQVQFDIGIVTWLGGLSIAGLAVVIFLSRRAVVTQQNPRRKRPANVHQLSKADTMGERLITRNAWRIPAAVMVTTLVVFFWQLLNTPQKPLLRDDAVRGQIGDWSFIIAEKDLHPPEIMALNTPLKTFVVRFCKSCERDIRLAYLKIRPPQSLRAAGSGFEGPSPEKEATISIPRAANLNDGLWLTVEGNDGSVSHQRFEIQQLSPALADFITQQL